MTPNAALNIDIDISWLDWQLDVFFEHDDAKYIIVPKGRRVGATRGGINAFFEWACDGITPMLWVDTINGNIDRYFERYMLPLLKQLRRGDWHWNANTKVLHIFESLIDFRSADSPQSIEGFGYMKIMLNEAGIILKDEYLYNNTILPMMLDFPESQLYAMGVPKGIHKKDGNQHTFNYLYECAKAGKPGYFLRQLTTFDNPKLHPDEINLLMDEMKTEAQRNQEIFGMFVDAAGENPFAESYDKNIHESERAIFIPEKQLVTQLDFNLNPFAVVFSHIWLDAHGLKHHTFDECEIARGSIPAMAQYIGDKYGHVLHNAVITGDAGGNRGDLSQSDQIGYYEQLRRALGMRVSQIKVPGNPTHETSRSDCNYLLHHSALPESKIEVLINPKTAPGVARDLKNVQCDAFGQIIKRDRKDMNQRADFLDCWRYGVNTFCHRFIIRHQKNMRNRRK